MPNKPTLWAKEDITMKNTLSTLKTPATLKEIAKETITGFCRNAGIQATDLAITTFCEDVESYVQNFHLGQAEAQQLALQAFIACR